MIPIRVLVCDDSATMRRLIVSVLEQDPDISVVGQAADPYEARQAVKTLNPDVITLDIEMPKMDGLEFLEKIMRLRPTPVIMVSTLTQRGADATLQALEIGAFDCVGKPSPGRENAFDVLPAKVKAAALAGRRGMLRSIDDRPTARAAEGLKTIYEPSTRIVAIGASTGGVEALTTVIKSLPKNCPPIVATLHLPERFTKTLAGRLDRECDVSVGEAADGAPLSPGHVYIAPGGSTHLEVRKSNGLVCRLRKGDTCNGHRPSVDVLFASIAASAGANAVGVILTGMGNDGAAGLLAMRNAGARTFGQDEKTSLVYGMPKVAFEMQSVERQIPLHAMAREILAATAA